MSNNEDYIVDKVTNLSLDVVTKSGKEMTLIFNINNIIDSSTISTSREYEDKTDRGIAFYREHKHDNLLINIKAENIGYVLVEKKELEK